LGPATRSRQLGPSHAAGTSRWLGNHRSLWRRLLAASHLPVALCISESLETLDFGHDLSRLRNLSASL